MPWWWGDQHWSACFCICPINIRPILRVATAILLALLYLRIWKQSVVQVTGVQGGLFLGIIPKYDMHNRIRTHDIIATRSKVWGVYCLFWFLQYSCAENKHGTWTWQWSLFNVEQASHESLHYFPTHANDIPQLGFSEPNFPHFTFSWLFTILNGVSFF